MAVEVAGKVAIVTGACSGIGLETSRLLAEEGAKVVLADLPTTDFEGAAAKVGSDAAYQPVDISDESSVRALIDFTIERYGRLDVVDNNATGGGDPADGRVADMSVEVWDRMFDVNARGAMLMSKYAIPRMIESGGGSIINISSGTAHAGADFATAYACTKAAVETLTRYIATQYGQHGIRCNAVAPGLTRTPKLESVMPEPMIDMFTEHTLVGRIGEPGDIAEVVCFLASDRAAFITGQVIAADGGMRAHLPTLVDVRRFAVEAQAQKA